MLPRTNHLSNRPKGGKENNLHSGRFTADTFVILIFLICDDDSPDYAWASTAGGEVLAYAYQKADKVDTQVRLM